MPGPHELPSDVLVQIFEQLSLRDMLRLCRVNRAFREAALCCSIWSELHIYPSHRWRLFFGKRHPERVFLQLLMHAGFRTHLKRVHIEVRRQSEFEHVDFDHDLGAAFLRVLGALESVCMSSQALPLESVRLNSQSITDGDLAALASHGTNLRELDLSGCERISGVGFARLAAACTRLETVSFAVGPIFRERVGVKALCEHCGPSLCSVTAEGLGRHGEAFCSLRALAAAAPNLTRLSVRDASFSEGLLAGLLEALRGLPALSAFEFTSDFSLERRQYLALAAACSELTELRLGVAHKKAAADAGLVAILTGCPGLRALSFTGVDEETVKAAVAAGLPPSLERLELGLHAGAQLGRELPAALAAMCPRLTALALDGAGYELAERRFLRTLAEACPGLLSLRVADCGSAVSDGDVVALAVRCTRLEELALCESARLTDAAALLLATHLKRLRRLDLTRCALLTDAALAALLAGCRRLESLRVQGCPRLTLGALEALAARGAALRQADFSTRQFGGGGDAARAAAAEIARLAERRPDLWSGSCGLPGELGDWGAPPPRGVEVAAEGLRLAAATALARQRRAAGESPPPGAGAGGGPPFDPYADAEPEPDGCSLQ